MTNTKSIIATKGLNVTYFPGQTNEVRALADIGIDISAGEFIIFFGPSGCGKSTLLFSFLACDCNHPQPMPAFLCFLPTNTDLMMKIPL